MSDEFRSLQLDLANIKLKLNTIEYNQNNVLKAVEKIEETLKEIKAFVDLELKKMECEKK
jgi:hypothetical protein